MGVIENTGMLVDSSYLFYSHYREELFLKGILVDWGAKRELSSCQPVPHVIPSDPLYHSIPTSLTRSSKSFDDIDHESDLDESTPSSASGSRRPDSSRRGDIE